ncbi:MAG: alpha-mannosidase [Ruminococcaceae bacterium]|nr:alpha-mannosidase [Oscillospiraceae bacterium]
MNLNKCLQSFLNTLNAHMSRRLWDVTGVELCHTDYKQGNDFPTNGWRAYDGSETLSGDDSHYWFRASLRTPEATEDEYLILRVSTNRDGGWNASNSQGLLYLNGYMAGGLDNNHTDILLEPETDYEIHNYFHIAMFQGGSAQHKMSVCAVNRLVEQLYYDVKVPFDACRMLSPKSEEYAKMMSTLADATRLVDFRSPGSPAFTDSIRNAIDFMAKEFYGKLCTTAGKPVVHCIGHTHIDVEWKWDRAQTREKIQRSFATAKALMDRYPEYNFMLSQPELYRYLKEEAPEKYDELKELVRKGRWEPEGAMYLEPDCNLTAGESLVRQILHGKRFFREEFGVDSRVLFLPDVFGYSAALPQILKKSGVDYFVTSKISWNDTNTMPVDMFYWQGIDGTEIFTSFMTAQKFGGQNRTTYNSLIDAEHVKGTWDRFQQKEYTDRIFMTFGYGDGGGGPTKAMLETQRRTAKGIPSLPVTCTDTLLPYLQRVKSEFDASCQRTGRIPKWVGELYLEFHRGTYTSIGKVKKSNRYSEFLLGAAEALSATHLSLGGDYDTEGLNRFWRKVLHNQFHDILPGSSIKAVYDGTDRDYAEISAYGQGVIRDKLQALAARIKTDGGTLVYNPTGFVRRAVIPTEKGLIESSKTVPSFGWTVVHDTDAVSKVHVDGLTAENDFYVLTLNRAGQIARLYDKRAEREVLSAPGNRLVAFEDYPTIYDAWELEEYYKLKSYELNDDVTITPITDGTRAGFTMKRHYMNSDILQTLWLYSESPRIDFETELDWHEHHQVIKAFFPLDVHATTATFDVQFGHVTRPTHQNTSWDEAKFETYAHKWVDVAEDGYGVALLNDGKFGHAVDGSLLSITLIKCATYPNPEADQGKQSFTYSLLPHTEDFRRGGVIEEGHFLNQPLYVQGIAPRDGDLPETYSFVSADQPNAVFSAVKQAEDGNGLVLRFHEAYNRRSIVTLTLPAGYSKAYLCDLMENKQEALEIREGHIRIPVSNFELITVKLEI